MTDKDAILERLSKAPDNWFDVSMTRKMVSLIGKNPTEQRDGLHEVLDLCAHAGLASDAGMLLLKGTWKNIFGGLDTDPTPWRDRL